MSDEDLSEEAKDMARAMATAVALGGALARMDARTLFIARDQGFIRYADEPCSKCSGKAEPRG